MERFLNVESDIMHSPLRGPMFREVWQKYPIRPGSEDAGAHLRADVTEEFRRRYWGSISILLQDVRVSLRMIINAPQPLLALEGAENVLLSEADRYRIAMTVAQGLCYTAGASELRRDVRKRQYLFPEAMKGMGADGRGNDDVVERYIEAMLFLRHGENVRRSVTP